MARDIIINRTTRKCYAKLAMAHFKEAEKEVAATGSVLAIDNTDRRMEAVERYIEKAGGQATEQVFGKWW